MHPPLPRPRRPFLAQIARLAKIGFGLLLCCGCALPVYAEPDSDPVPRPISDAEHQTAELLLEYLDQGASGWWQALATSSPLREWGEDGFAAELEIRLGPRRGSRFTLQTPGTRHDQNTALVRIDFASGLEELVELIFISDQNELKLHQLRILAEPRPSDQTINDMLDISLRVQPPSSNPFAPAIATLAVMLCALLLIARKARLPGWLLCAGLLALACSQETEPSPASKAAIEVEPDAIMRLAILAPLREAVVGGTELDLDQLGALIPPTAKGQVRQTARAWTAQILLSSGRLAQARKVLEGQPTPSMRPLVELLRARLAFLQSNDQEILAVYDRALLRAPDVDHFRLEAAYAALVMARDDQARIGFEMAMRAGSRMSEAWLVASQLAALEDRLEEAERRFKLGFGLQPMTRESLFDDPLLSAVATRPAIFPLLRFSETEEPSLSLEEPATRPLQLPAGAQAVLLGERLDIELGGSTLRILGAADLTPAGVAGINAAAAERQEREQTLSRLDALTRAVNRPGGLAHPGRQREAKVAALALAKQHRWNELLRLTDADEDPAIPADLIKLRGLALLESGRDVEAKNLLIRLAQSDRVNRRRDPGTYYQLAEMFVRTGEYDLALKLIRKANGMSPQKVSPQRIRQIEMDRELDAAFKTFESDHFVLRYPRATGEKYPRQLSWVLEAEWQRLRQWIPVDGKSKVEIHLFELDEFMNAYSGGVAVLGIYDGKVRVPLADLKSFHPLLVNIVSHEIAHAMIDEATGGQTPKWFNEGLASHIEMDQKTINPIPDMHAAGRYLSFAIMEPVLAGFSEPQLVELAYSHSTWALHFIEERHGIKAIHQFLRAFKDGLDSEAALKRVLRQDIAQFDGAFKNWALNKAPKIWPTQLVRYEKRFDALIERDSEPQLRAAAKPAARRFALPPARPNESDTQAAEGKKTAQESKRSAPSAPESAAERAIKAWHATYAEKTRPIKVALGQTLSILNGKAEGDLNTSCRQLSRQLESLQSDPEALATPSKSLSRALDRAYRYFEHAAGSCMRGDRQRMGQNLEQATTELARAHRELQRYGLKP